MKQDFGFTLIEMIITILFFAIVMFPLATMLTSTLLGSVDDKESYTASIIARDLLEEMQAVDYEDETGSTFGNEETVTTCDRVLFDDVDDYDIYQLWGGCTPPRTKSGGVIEFQEQFTENISVQNIKDIEAFAPDYIRNDFTPQTDGSTNSKQVLITITWPRGKYEISTLIMRRNEEE